MNRIALVAALVVLALAAYFGVGFVKARARRAAYERFGQLNAQYDCCASAARPECSRAAEDLKGLAAGSDEVAYLARTQYVAQCPAFGAKVVVHAAPAVVPRAAEEGAAPPDAGEEVDDGPEGASEEVAMREPDDDAGEAADPEDEGDGDFAAYVRDVPSAVVEVATGRRIPLEDEAGWQAVALTGPDGGLAGVAYEEIAEDSGCESARVALLGPGGRFDRFVYSNGMPEKIHLAEGATNDPARHTARWKGVSIDAVKLSVSGVEVLHGCKLPGDTSFPDAGPVNTAWALVAPDGSLVPMPSVPLQ